MNVLWAKQRLHKILSKETVTVHAHASGDGCSASSRCCRLCGGDNNLRNFRDTYVWEGVEARYDQLLYECFGVTVSSPDCHICGCCVRQLKSTEQFRALVHAAFDKTVSEIAGTLTSKHSEALPKKPSTEHTYVVAEKDHLPKPVPRSQRISHHSNKNRVCKLKSALNKTCSLQRANVACNICRQRYPAMVPKQGYENFICSRCKKNSVNSEVCRRSNLGGPANTITKHLELHVKPDLQTNNRLHSRNTTQQVRAEIKQKAAVLPKYKCSQCSKNFDMAVNLLNHKKIIHGDSSKCLSRLWKRI